MRKINFAKITWISCLFLALTIILIMVMDYKIHYQYLEQTHLYFYECSGNLCVSEIKDDNKLLYSYYDCNFKTCPAYKKNLGDNYVLLEQNNKLILFDYRKNKIISNEYENYHFITEKYIIVTNKNKQGIIDNNGKIIVTPNYDEIGYKNGESISGYNFSWIIVKKNNQYGIISYTDGSIIEEIKYTEADINKLLEILKSASNSR